jgi:hypothetical protein
LENNFLLFYQKTTTTTTTKLSLFNMVNYLCSIGSSSKKNKKITSSRQVYILERKIKQFSLCFFSLISSIIRVVVVATKK